MVGVTGSNPVRPTKPSGKAGGLFLCPFAALLFAVGGQGRFFTGAGVVVGIWLGPGCLGGRGGWVSARTYSAALGVSGT